MHSVRKNRLIEDSNRMYLRYYYVSTRRLYDYSDALQHAGGPAEFFIDNQALPMTHLVDFTESPVTEFSDELPELEGIRFIANVVAQFASLRILGRRVLVQGEYFLDVREERHIALLENR